jgi:hypothetical protein
LEEIMTAIYDHYKRMYRFWSPVHGPIKGAFMAFKDAIRPVPF